MTDGADEEVKEASLYATELFVQLGHICRRILAGNRSLAHGLGTIILKRLSSNVGSSVLVSKTLQHRPRAEGQAVERALSGKGGPSRREGIVDSSSAIE